MANTNMNEPALIDRLAGTTEADWDAAVEALLPEIHEVDRGAVQIWLRFYPLGFRRYVESAPDRDELVRSLALQGDWDLATQIDSSHHFLYGHRYWKSVKDVIAGRLRERVAGDPGLEDLIRDLADEISQAAKAPKALVTAITIVGLMTANQVGLDRFVAAPGTVTRPAGQMAKSPDAIVADRAKDDSQGLLGFLRTVDKKFSVHFLDSNGSGRFSLINDEEIASASGRDRSKDWKSRDPRCWEGVVPVECRSASCGTCWVGVLGGQEKLAEVGRRERRQMKVFGYKQPEEAKPLLRLACQAKAYGNVTIVIPPWNGVFGKKVYGNVEELELEPATTSAKRLRETVKEVISTTAE
ncbi:MAG: 2Fe-2S iron-sulfur cluster-binding protein [Pyrinomonadaceae bacterium]